ncbi:MAG: methylated-DNA--[protein]-cysteine S-methyltransferase [Bryobacteraceae bacterium]|nr:methylated-DNA--[protein]-cysteine S-methyltransferase [Bryobacteraceae bacterium]
MTNAERWSAYERRERDARFIIAVRTTKIYCRPSCPARRPKPENVTLYDTVAEAREAGFRACKRCKPDDELEPRAGLVADLCRFMEANRERRITLEELSEFAGLSPFHLQRTFRAELGVSPREYLAALRRRESAPGDVVTYGFFESALGPGLIAETRQGVCAVSFSADRGELLTWLREQMPYATLGEGVVDNAVRGLLEYIETGSSDLPLDVRGTVFQQKVWNALRSIPPGETRTYEQLASASGRPDATRAAGTACGSNRIAVLIPCHRALRKDGGLGGYRWGLDIKREMLKRELKA